MRSESEVRWVRAKNTVGGVSKVSQWHAIIPGLGDLNLPPGTVCNTGLTGSLQFASDVEVKTLDGRRHPECSVVVDAWVAEIDPSPGPLVPPDDPPKLDPPKTTYTEMRRRTR